MFELHGSVIDEPVEIQSIKVYVPNDDEGRTTTVIGNAFPDSEVKCITPFYLNICLSDSFKRLLHLTYCSSPFIVLVNTFFSVRFYEL